MNAILSFWYLQSPGWTYEAFKRSLSGLEGRLAVADMVRNLGKPLFQDYSPQGRMIGTAIRLIRICLGCLLYLITALAYSVGFLVWVLFPLICALAILGSLIGPHPSGGA